MKDLFHHNQAPEDAIAIYMENQRKINRTSWLGRNLLKGDHLPVHCQMNWRVESIGSGHNEFASPPWFANLTKRAIKPHIICKWMQLCQIYLWYAIYISGGQIDSCPYRQKLYRSYSRDEYRCGRSPKSKWV